MKNNFLITYVTFKDFEQQKMFYTNVIVLISDYLGFSCPPVSDEDDGNIKNYK